MIKIPFTEDHRNLLKRIYEFVGFSKEEIPGAIEELCGTSLNSAEIDSLIYSINSCKKNYSEEEMKEANELISFLETEKKKISITRNSVDLSEKETDNSC